MHAEIQPHAVAQASVPRAVRANPARERRG
jgi:hypothetical protein